jgi:hypothetical protein
MCSSRQRFQNQTHKQKNSLGAKDLTLRGGRGAAGKRGTVDKPKWEIGRNWKKVQETYSECSARKKSGSASLSCGCFQGVAAGPLEGAPEGELKREYARLAGSSSGRVGCAKNLKAVGQAAGGAASLGSGHWWDELLLPFTERTSFSRGFVGLVNEDWWHHPEVTRRGAQHRSFFFFGTVAPAWRHQHLGWIGSTDGNQSAVLDHLKNVLCKKDSSSHQTCDTYMEY